MATTGAALGPERGYLTRAWFAMVGVVIVAAAAIAITLAMAGRAPAGGTSPTPMKDYRPVQVQHGPVVVNSEVCGQCR